MSLRVCGFVAVISWSAYSQTSDVTPPSLESFSFGPTSVDTRSRPQNLTFTMQVSDDLSGVDYVWVRLAGPNGQWRWFFPQRSAGTPTLGTYSITYAFPQFTASGDWRVDWVRLEDFTGNIAHITTSTLRARGLQAAFNVVSTPDVTPVQIASLAFVPATLNLSAADTTVTLRMRLVDSESGVGIESTMTGCNCTYKLLILRSPSGNQLHRVGNTEFRLVSGTRNDGIWEGSFVMPRYSEPGAWTVFSLYTYDAVLNGLDRNSGSLAAADLPANLTVAPNASADTTGPVLTNLALSATTIDPSLAPQTVTVTFGVQDNRSGADFVRENPCPCRLLGVRLLSPSGNQYAETLFNPFTLVGGTPLNGTWTGTIVFPRYAEAGTWRMSAYLKDRTQNERQLTPDQLRAAGFPSSLNVIRPSYVPDGTIPSSGGTVMDETFGSQASITIPNGALPGPTTISIDVLERPPDIVAPQGFSAPVTRFVNFELAPHPVAPIGPPGYTITIPLVNPLPAGTPLTLFRLDPISGNLVPARSVSAGFVPGSVDASGRTATFTGIASFSTVVGLLSSGQKPGDLNGDTIVNCADVTIVHAAFGKRTGQSGFDSRADVNRDGIVNISDLSFVLRQLPAGVSCQ